MNFRIWAKFVTTRLILWETFQNSLYMGFPI